jgi:arylsulfatase A-like enzyme
VSDYLLAVAVHIETSNTRSVNDSDIAIQSQPLRPIGLVSAAILVLLWFGVPTYARLMSGPELSSTEFLICVLQDFAALAEIFLLSMLVKTTLPSSKWLYAGFCTLFFLGLLYLLVDFYLLDRLGIRMQIGHLLFLQDPGPFLSSAASMQPGLGLLLLGLGGLAAFMLYRQPESLNLLFEKRYVSGVAVLIILAALIAGPTLRQQIHIESANVIIKQQIELLASPSKLASLAAEPLSDTPAFDTDFVRSPLSNEVSTFIDQDYPLLRDTNGFSGPKKFSIDVSDDEKPHLIFLFLESYRAKDVGVLGGKFPASPEFDRLSKDGILFSNFYATGVQTTRAVVSSLYGIMPRFSKAAVQSDHPDIKLQGLPEIMHDRGYTNAFFHNGSLAFEKKQAFFSNHQYDKIFGDKDIALATPDAKQSSSWGLHDEYLMDFTLDWLEKHDPKGPAFITMFTVSNHHPWNIPTWHTPPSFDVDEPTEYANYLRSFNYSDHALGQFIDGLRATGLAKKSIVFILADTATPMGEHNDNHMLIKYLYEENLRIPLLIIADGRTQADVVASLSSQVDLLPTVMDILGIEDRQHSIGQSLLRQQPSRSVYFNNPFHLGYYGLREDNLKFLYSVQNNQQQIFDLAKDPTESNNIVQDHPEFAKRSLEAIANMAGLHDYLYGEQRFTKP